MARLGITSAISPLAGVECGPTARAVVTAELGQGSRITFRPGRGRHLAHPQPRRISVRSGRSGLPAGEVLCLADLLALLSPGGLYIVDDLLPRATWAADHPERVNDFLAHLPDAPNLLTAPLRWASGRA
ncbi:hypothetical protein ACFYW8_36885 [Streptomyces sp. NPDC002742]|uniref:hypothetical protein n=1 Tax=Streptomyces sp. NPDC002742 TaxID=3364663 RepID=UPI00368643ED